MGNRLFLVLPHDLFGSMLSLCLIVPCPQKAWITLVFRFLAPFRDCLFQRKGLIVDDLHFFLGMLK